MGLIRVGKRLAGDDVVSVLDEVVRSRGTKPGEMITIGNGPTVHLGIGRRLSSRFFQPGRAPAENLVPLTFQVDQTWGEVQGL